MKKRVKKCERLYHDITKLEKKATLGHRAI